MRPMRWWDLEQVIAIEIPVFGPTAWSPESFWGSWPVWIGTTWSPTTGGPGVRGLWIAAPDADVQTIAVAPGAQGGAQAPGARPPAGACSTGRMPTHPAR